ncbi:DUF5686 and carboxypeptidase regulatory-like domain-containing protein [Paracrocinitomix mangrovi]|uniref:carboxypeptidase-like regulatory domain-containing protein n=1 Tax=Paracrocinitomix mangrovi TaxID=2862509 RepID=UPI001C8E54FD|nr:carboxypeptidase-like regulatory domain-containing protein [Paracrocinitomix mangrovi]UKN02189.1 DUF5686 and carboxypeptidase regulatory-like domain-containing protein [Paracrocinitomix mangrovi]
MSQSDDDCIGMNLGAKVVNNNTKEAVAFAKVYSVKSGKGTVTNELGEFKLKEISCYDSLRISFIGFETKTISVVDLIVSNTIKLNEKENLLSTVNVLADNSFLYQLVISCAKNKKTPSQQAKTYFQLESSSNGKTVEMLESYYNGTFKDYNVSKLDIKAGRVGLAHQNGHFVLSTETSKAILEQDLFKPTSLFPANPLSQSKKELYTNYSLSLSQKFAEGENQIFAIRFTPRKEANNFFSGIIWIDSASSSLRKIQLEIENSNISPFAPSGSTSKISAVDIQISKTFNNIEDETYLSEIQFNYQFDLVSQNGSVYTVNSKAYLYAFNYEEIFDLPFFDFVEGMHQDYLSISAFPYVESFWQSDPQFELYQHHQKVTNFIKNDAQISNDDIFRHNQYRDRGFFNNEYVGWNENRIVITERKLDNNYQDKGIIAGSRYNLEAQIFLDVNTVNDTVVIYTKSILDPFRSYYSLDINNASLAFINMFFDLIEIKRRQLDNQLMNIKDFSEIKTLYTKEIADLNEITTRFFKEVQHGTEADEMIKWNSYIKGNLGIDNLDIFQVTFEN